jgi:uncharacterized lipoprotein YddW (UPF0748 family)
MFRASLLIVTCLLASPGSAAGQKPASPADAQAPFMGAYVHMPQVFAEVKDDVAASREAIARSMDRFKASGLHVVMPYATATSGSAMFDSRIIPDRHFAGWDPLAVFVEESRKRELQIWPVVCVVTCGHDKPKGILRKHPEWALRDIDGKPLGYLSPCNPQARQWIVSVMADMVTRYQPDGILLDYLRYPNHPVQLDPESQARFERENPGYASADAAGKKQMLQAFRERELTELTRMISEETRRLKPDIQLGLYTWGPHVTKSHHVAQMWPMWAARGYLDMLNISGYCFEKNYGEKYLEVFERRLTDAAQLLREAGGSTQITFTLGVKTSHGQVEKAEEIEQYLRIASRVGMRGVAVFTWPYLQPFIDEVDKAGYLRAYERRVAKTPAPELGDRLP